jgi:hypothetical protein
VVATDQDTHSGAVGCREVEFLRLVGSWGVMGGSTRGESARRRMAFSFVALAALNDSTRSGKILPVRAREGFDAETQLIHYCDAPASV